MTRHSLTLCGLVFGSLLATTAMAQVYDPTTPDQRVSQLRPGWSREGIDPAASRARYVVAPAPIQLVDDNETSHSFLPNWFGWGNSKPPQQQQQQQQQNYKSNQQHSNNAKTNNQRSSMPENGNDSTPPDPASMQDDQLPGLGGAPLPRSNSQQQGTSAGNRSNTNPSNSSSRNVQGRGQSSSLQQNSSTPHVASRDLSPPADQTITDDGPSVTRSSPGRRTAPHITPDELRRELSGTFPTPTAKSEQNGSADGHNDNGMPAMKPRTSRSMPAESDAVISDSQTDQSPSDAAKTDMDSSKQLRSEAARANTSNAESSRSAAEAFGGSHGAHSAYGSSNSVHIPFSTVTPTLPQAARGKEAFGDALQVASGGDPSVLASNQTPVLNVDIRGPKQILVGREAVYRVRLQNQSDVPAEGIVASVRIPSGAEVINTTTTQGTVQPTQDAQAPGQLQWHIQRLEHRASETMEIHLIPRESRPLELGVSWSLAAVGSRAIVEVQEAKLNLEIAGPSEVLFDKPQAFKLTITNPGTGPAENVKIDLLPPGGNQEAGNSHKLGDLAAGASQTLEVELTPRDAGKMLVKATAVADGGLKSEASKEIFCRKPELEVDWRGPATKYAGTMATFFVRVRNPGTAPAEDVTVHATLPEGAEFTSASEGQTFDTHRHEVSWRVGTLAPGDDNYMELKCVLKSAGKNIVKLAAASATGDLTDSKIAETNVIAIADLKLDVTDPSGPVAVGAQAVYEIHIRNRGESAAKDVNAVALFSEGIEPEQAEGAMYTITDGRVSFHTIEELEPGREIVLRIRAHATQPGTHVFRAEVLCRDLDIKLATEETTRFYADDVAPNSDKPQKEAASRSAAFNSSVK